MAENSYKVKTIWEYNLEDLPDMMAALGGLDRLEEMARRQAEEVGGPALALLRTLTGSLRIAANQLLDIKNKTSPRPSGGEDQGN